jgi:hypothetical protein
MALLVVEPVRFGAHAAELDGVQVPETVQVNGKSLHLNGFGLRTYSIMNLHIYVAGLYLEHLNNNPEQIIHSPETRLLVLRFVQNVSAEEVQNAWRTALENNCIAPCHLDPEDVSKFLSQLPDMHVGDNFNLVFTQIGGTLTVNGQQIGTISRRQFADAVLAAFLGPNPASPTLKQGLLAGHS